MIEDLNLNPDDRTKLEAVKGRLTDFCPFQNFGRVAQVVGLVIEGKGPVCVGW